MNDWRDEEETPRRLLSAGMCPCDECQADDGAQTTDLDPEEFN
jgi:hypothetical protein